MNRPFHQADASTHVPASLVGTPPVQEVGQGELMGASLRDRATHQRRSLFHVSALWVGIACAVAGCEFDADAALKRDRQWAYDTTYDNCIARVTGMFSSAPIEVMKECQRQAEAARKAVL